MPNPFLKWAGGKRWLVKSQFLPEIGSFFRYLEPFLGSAAMFFHMRPASALLSDINPELIETYKVIKESAQSVLEVLYEHQAAHNNSYYYKIRESLPQNPAERAARFIYLNRTCWNGLYRVNRAGKFNVPIGTRSKVVLEYDNLEKIADALLHAEIQVLDFKESIPVAEKGDFLFVDPPYTVQHNNNNFIKYNETIFRWSDQVELCDLLFSARNRGVKIVLTNADHDSIRELYRGFGTYIQAERKSLLAASASRRCATSEAIFLANI